MDAHLEAQSNQRYLDESDFIDTKKGISSNVEFKEFHTENNSLKLSL
jgi:hypothetical protein